MVDVFDRHGVRFDPRLAGCSRFVRHSDYAALEAENARLKEINANLMGDDEDTPRYTTKRLKQEIAKAVARTEASAAVKVGQILNEIACWSQSEGLLWWQVKAREALSALSPAPQEAEVVRVYEPYPGAFDNVLGPDKVQEAEAVAIPVGWYLVPEVPTEDQMSAGLYQASHDAEYADVCQSYMDMVRTPVNAPALFPHPPAPAVTEAMVDILAKSFWGPNWRLTIPEEVVATALTAAQEAGKP